MERKMIRISGKRQITIPQKYFDLLGFDTEASVFCAATSWIIRPVSELQRRRVRRSDPGRPDLTGLSGGRTAGKV